MRPNWKKILRVLWQQQQFPGMERLSEFCALLSSTGPRYSWSTHLVYYQQASLCSHIARSRHIKNQTQTKAYPRAPFSGQNRSLPLPWPFDHRLCLLPSQLVFSKMDFLLSCLKHPNDLCFELSLNLHMLDNCALRNCFQSGPNTKEKHTANAFSRGAQTFP